MRPDSDTSVITSVDCKQTLGNLGTGSNPVLGTFVGASGRGCRKLVEAYEIGQALTTLGRGRKV